MYRLQVLRHLRTWIATRDAVCGFPRLPSIFDYLT